LERLVPRALLELRDLPAHLDQSERRAPREHKDRPEQLERAARQAW
jgi:hypothetical protein